MGLFLLLGVIEWGEGALTTQLASQEPLPAITRQTVVRLLVADVFIEPADPAQAKDEALMRRIGFVTRINYLLAGLCTVVASGLALRSRLAYFAALVLSGLLAVSAVGGILAGLSGWVPACVRLGATALGIFWLVDSSPAFEWEVRHYDAGLDRDLRTHLDYYHRGVHYQELGMWAKAAVHWRVACQLAPAETAYPLALAKAYVHMGERGAALILIEQASVRAPDDPELRTFRDSLVAIARG